MQIFVTILMFVGVIIYLVVGGFLGVLYQKKKYKEYVEIDDKFYGACLGVCVAFVIGGLLFVIWGTLRFNIVFYLF